MITTIEVDFPGGKRVDARVGETVIRTDQSRQGGGEGSAPEPFMLFLSSIATCAGIYALGFCQSRHLPTEGLALAMDCEADPVKKRFTKMTLRLTLPAGFPREYESAIRRAMDQCAVKKHIVEPPAFAIEVL